MTTEQNHSSEYLRQEALRRTRCAFVFAALAAAVLVMIVLNINTGSVRIPVARILRILFLRQGEENEVSIIWKIRMPRILLAAELGGALALSGFLLQTFFGNPIAGPFVLGISSGAKMCVALVMIVFLGRFGAVSSWTLVLAAFAGAMLSTALILLVARKVQHMAALLVAGIMNGYICSAVTEFLVTFAEDSDIVNLHGWSQGSFSGADWSSAGTAALITGTAFFLVFLLAKPISAYQMGEAYARSMGVNIKLFRAGGTHPAFGDPVRLRRRLRGTGLLCGDRCPLPGEAGPGHLEAAGCDSRVFPGRGGVLPGLRPDRPDGFFTHGAEHQHGHLRDRSAGGDLHADPETQVTHLLWFTDQYPDRSEQK